MLGNDDVYVDVSGQTACNKYIRQSDIRDLQARIVASWPFEYWPSTQVIDKIFSHYT